MKNLFLIIFIILCLACTTGCGQKIKLVPEITSNITEENVLDLESKETVGRIIERDNRLIFITLKGEVFSLETREKQLTTPVNLGTKIDPEIFVQDNFAVLKEADKNRYFILDLDNLPGAREAINMNMDRVIAVNENLVVFRRRNRLVFFNYRSRKTMQKPVVKDIRLFNSDFSGHILRILSSKNLYTYDTKNDRLHTLELKHPPASGFLADGKYIYYGSANRELVKFAPQNGKTQWAFKLPVLLDSRPVKAGTHICITPTDNNIYFFTTRGTLQWWHSLDSPRALDPVAMKKDVAVFLMNREYRKMKNKIRFFNYEKKEVVSFQSKHQLESNPVYMNDYLYILCEDIDRQVKTISRVGNRYALETEIEPAEVKPVNKSLEFKITPINLIEPEYRAVIVDKEGNQVFEKKLAADDPSSFVWIPEKAGMYELQVQADAQNQKGLTGGQKFKVVDMDTILESHYYLLQQGCDDETLPGKQAKKAPEKTVGDLKEGKNVEQETGEAQKTEAEKQGKKKNKKGKKNKKRAAGKKKGEKGN